MECIQSRVYGIKQLTVSIQKLDFINVRFLLKRYFQAHLDTNINFEP